MENKNNNNANYHFAQLTETDLNNITSFEGKLSDQNKKNYSVIVYEED